MTDVFVANASMYKLEFHYWMPNQKKRRALLIQPMSQIKLPDDFDNSDLDSLIKQHQLYGFIRAEELTAGTVPKANTSLTYRLGTPVSQDTIEYLRNINRGILDQFGRQLRREAAIITNQTLVNTLDQQRRYGLEANLDTVETTIQEEEPDSGYGDREPIGEGYVVSEGKDNQPINAPRRRGLQ